MKSLIYRLDWNNQSFAFHLNTISQVHFNKSKINQLGNSTMIDFYSLKICFIDDMPTIEFWKDEDKNLENVYLNLVTKWKAVNPEETPSEQYVEVYEN